MQPPTAAKHSAVFEESDGFRCPRSLDRYTAAHGVGWMVGVVRGGDSSVVRRGREETGRITGPPPNHVLSAVSVSNPPRELQRALG